MKSNARLASAPLSGSAIDWTSHAPGREPGASLLVDRLAAYTAAEGSDLKVHLVGHSAGAVVLAALLERLVANGITVESMQLMGGAIRSDDFVGSVIPRLRTSGGSGEVRRFVAYDLTEKAEQDDACPGGPVAVYHKSLLYLVARSLEASSGAYEVPMLGLEKALATPWKMPDGTIRPLIDAIGGPENAVICPNMASRADQRSRASGHGQFDEDVDTLTSVLLQIMDRRTIGSLTPYPPGGMPSLGT